MKTKTNLKAGRIAANHNQTLLRAAGVKVKTSMKAGRIAANHNQSLLRAAALRS